MMMQSHSEVEVLKVVTGSKDGKPWVRATFGGIGFGLDVFLTKDQTVVVGQRGRLTLQWVQGADRAWRASFVSLV